MLAYRSPACIGKCDVCRFDTYPYTAQSPIKEGGKYPDVEFHNDKDVQRIIDKIILEVGQVNKEKGKKFNVAEAVFGQLPFFACKRFLYSNDAQKDIHKYSYCSEFKVPAYEGAYGNHPKKWIDKSFFIKNVIGRQKENDASKNIK